MCLSSLVRVLNNLPHVHWTILPRLPRVVAIPPYYYPGLRYLGVLHQGPHQALFHVPDTDAGPQNGPDKEHIDAQKHHIQIYGQIFPILLACS